MKCGASSLNARELLLLITPIYRLFSEIGLTHGDEHTQAVCVGGYSRCLLKCQTGPCCSEGFPITLVPLTPSSDSHASWWIITLFGDSPCKCVYFPPAQRCESRSCYVKPHSRRFILYDIHVVSAQKWRRIASY